MNRFRLYFALAAVMGAWGCADNSAVDVDLCPDNPLKTSPGACGCDVDDVDANDNGVIDCLETEADLCPDDSNKTEPGICGCGAPDIDANDNGVIDCLEMEVDLCPNDPDKTKPGICGCGVPDDDSNNNGTPDCQEDVPTECAEPKCEIGQKECRGNLLLSCKVDFERCPTWTFEEECDGWCNPDGPACESCEGDQCKPGEKQCDENEVLECQMDSNGCTTWSSILTCDAAKEHCDEEDFTCKLGCTNQCEENQTRCGSSVDDAGTTHIETQKCTINDETGCTVWETDATCSEGQTCQDASVENMAKCVYTCGTSDSEGCKPFSLIILPDTQYYTSSDKCKLGNDDVLPADCIYKKQTQWIADHKNDENIKFVMHLGDLVNSNNAAQYQRAVKAHQVLSDNDIPYSVATGNHEYGVSNSYYGSKHRVSTLFNQFFNDDLIKAAYPDSSKDSYYGNWFHGFKSDGSMYATFEVGDLKFAVVALEFAPRKDVLCWADNLIQTELRDRYVILTTHAYLDRRTRGVEETSFVRNENNDFADNTIYEYFNGVTMLQSKDVYWSKYAAFGASGMEVYKELAARHSNIIMVAGGHQCGVIHREHSGNNDNTIHELLVDYQCEQPVDSEGKPTNPKVSKACEENSNGDDAGNGWLVQLKIDPKSLSNNIQVSTHSVLSEYNEKENSFNCSSDPNAGLNYQKNKTDSDHSYSFTYDFSKPLEYQYKNDDTSFGVRAINEIEYGNQQLPKVAMSRKTGAFVAVWEDDSDPSDGTSEVDWTLYVNSESQMQLNPNIDPDDTESPRKTIVNYDIMARLFCASGCVESPSFIASSRGGQQRHPDVAMDDDGNFVVVWEDDQDKNGYTEGYMRGFDSKGHQRFTSKFHSDSGGQQLMPHISMNSKGTYVIVWYNYGRMFQDTPNVRLSIDIMFSLYNANGSPIQTDQFVVSLGDSTDAALNIDRALDVAMAEDGSFVVMWRNNDNNIYAKRFDADGKAKPYDETITGYNAETQILQVNTTSLKALHYQPSIGMNAKGDYVITYIECLQSCLPDDPHNCSIDHCQIMARGFDKDSKEILPDSKISEDDKIDFTSNPTVCLDDSGNSVFGWKARTISYYDTLQSNDYEFGDIRRKRLDSQGKPIGSIDTIHHNTVGDQAYPDVACTADGKHTFVFTDDVDEDNDTEIFGRGYRSISN